MRIRTPVGISRTDRAVPWSVGGTDPLPGMRPVRARERLGTPQQRHP